jgi:hypothetical protein
MLRLSCFFAFIILAIGGAGRVTASPFSLYYTITDVGKDNYGYYFWLILDNHDHSWVPGQGWGGIVFGDKLNSPSKLTNFAWDQSFVTTPLYRFPSGPFAFGSFTSGEHNGPTLLLNSSSEIAYWIPSTGNGNSVPVLHWSGTSSYPASRSSILFSTLYTTGGAAPVNFQAGQMVPDSGTTLYLCILGISTLLLVRRIPRRTGQPVAARA